MPDPLAGDEDGQLDVVLDVTHLERRGVGVAHQVSNQACVLPGALGAGAVGNAGGLHHGAVAAHVVDDAHEAVIKNRQGLVEDCFEIRNGQAARGGLDGSQVLDFLLFRASSAA